jgi:hypothetical protein
MSVWQVQDVLNVARVYERMSPTLLSKGMSFDDALAKTERYNLQYKVPSRVLLPGKAGRSLSNTLRSPKIFFGNYAYDKYRVAGNIAKDALNPKTLLTNPKSNFEALDKVAMMGAIAAVVWPQVEKGIQNITGNSNAHMTAPGVSAIPYTASRVLSGKESATEGVESQLQLGAPVTLGMQLYNNQDSFTGEPIADPNASPAQKSKQTASWLLSQMAPSQKLAGVKNSTKNQVGSTLLSLAGATLPKNSPATDKLESLTYDTLPMVTSQMKSQAQKGDIAGAQATMNNYNQQLLTTTKQALKSENKPVPSDSELEKNLKTEQFWLSRKTSTLQGYQKSKNTTMLDKLAGVQ